MRDLLSVDREANQLRLRRSTFLGTFLLVEGHSDKIFYERFVNPSVCEVVCISGKPSSKLRVIAVLEILDKSSFQGVLGIVDADCDRLETSLYNNPNLLRTDSHDLETMIIDSPALEKVLSEFGSPDKIEKFNQDIRKVLLEAGLSVGYLRWVSQCDKLNLKFDGLTFSKFVDNETLKINELQLIRHVKEKSQHCLLEDKEIQKQLTTKKNSHDPWQVCCGHDLVEILSIGLRKAIGSKKAIEVEPDNLERSLRLAYEKAYFLETRLYSDIRTWKKNNQHFLVLQNG